MPEISVIVPVYNADRTLQRCIDSILDQSFRDFELILVNDESKDSSKSICEKNAEKCEIIRFLDKKWGGYLLLGI